MLKLFTVKKKIILNKIQTLLFNTDFDFQYLLFCVKDNKFRKIPNMLQNILYVYNYYTFFSC